MLSNSLRQKNNYIKRSFDLIILTILSAAIMSISFCSPPTEKKTVSFLYDLNRPDENYTMPKYLKEISGITYQNGDNLLCIQDEKAIIYVFNLTSKKVSEKYIFGNDGDYEDIALSGRTAFIIRSDGNIFEIIDFAKEKTIIKEHKTKLTERNNTEGLAFDKLTNSLLIACKGSPSIKNEFISKENKAIYRFELGEMKLVENPQMINNVKNFQPSGIAINPMTEEIYIISGVSNMLLVIERDGNIRYSQKLDPRIFRQPEGICFSPSGDLFISNEGGNGNGNILRFNLKRKTSGVN